MIQASPMVILEEGMIGRNGTEHPRQQLRMHDMEYQFPKSCDPSRGLTNGER